MPGDMAVEGPDAGIVLFPLEDLFGESKSGVGSVSVNWLGDVHRWASGRTGSVNGNGNGNRRDKHTE